MSDAMARARRRAAWGAVMMGREDVMVVVVVSVVVDGGSGDGSIGCSLASGSRRMGAVDDDAVVHAATTSRHGRKGRTAATETRSLRSCKAGQVAASIPPVIVETT